MTKAQAHHLAAAINSGAIRLPRVQYATTFRFSDGTWMVRLNDCDGLRVRALRTVVEVLDDVGWNAR